MTMRIEGRQWLRSTRVSSEEAMEAGPTGTAKAAPKRAQAIAKKRILIDSEFGRDKVG